MASRPRGAPSTHPPAMHFRPDHAELDAAALRRFIRAHPLGLLTTAIASPSAAFPLLQSTHLPFVLDDPPEPPARGARLGRLRGHLARQNPQARAMTEALAAAAAAAGPDGVLEHDVLVVFTSPAQHYITPSFYPEAMAAGGRTAPTWNYAAAQVYGRARVFHDADAPAADAFLARQLADLARMGEAGVMGYGAADAWRPDDAPPAYLARSKRLILGIEIDVVRLEGRVKMSQELRPADRAAVVAGLRGLGTETAARVAALVEERARRGEADAAVQHGWA